MEQGALHLGFKLDSRSEQIGLYQVGAGIIDSLSYTNEYPDIPIGRIPDGSSNIQYVSATPGWGNTIDRKEGVFINEFAASNLTMVMDEYGEFNDWIEIYNANDVPVNLGGFFFTDSLGNPTKFRIPLSAPDSTTIPPYGHMVFWADGQEELGVKHLGFKLDSRSEQIGLYQVGAGMIDSLTYFVEHTDISMGRFPDGNSQLQYLSATPGEVNHVRKLEGIQINEFMVKNTTTVRDEYGEFDDWIEIYNGNNYPVDLGGVFFTDSLGFPTKYRIPMGRSDSTTIPAYGFLIFWADNQREQGVLHLDFSLSGEGEQIGLVQPDGKHFIDTLTFGASYTDQSLGLLETEPDIFQIVFPSPGLPNYLEPSAKLYISEIVASGNESNADQYGEYDDWIEIYNDNDFNVNIGGFYLTDSMNHLQKFRIPSNRPDSTTIESGCHLILWADNQPEQGITHLGFKLEGEGEHFALTGIDGVGIIDSVSFPNQFKHFSYSREGDSGEWKYFPVTFGVRNVAPQLSGLLINEFMTSNSSIPDENGEFEDWFEIFNTNPYSVDVGGLYLTDSIGAPTKFRIPSHTPSMSTISPQGYLVFFADDQQDQGINHVNFKLKREGEQIVLLHYDERTVIDSLSYRKQFNNASTSRLQIEGEWYSIPPTPGAENIYPDLSNLVINEVMGNNKTVIGDDYEEYENWLELYNKGDTPINIGGLYFSDSLADQYKFRMSSEYPDSTSIDPYGYLTLWADNETSQGILHLGFKIAKTGEKIGIFDYTGLLVDSISYPFIGPNLSWGRMPDGFEVWTQFLQPTPSQSNSITLVQGRGVDELKVKLYPNPVSETAVFEVPVDNPGKIRIEIVNAQGSLISIIQTYGTGTGPELISWDVRDVEGRPLLPGMFIFRVVSGTDIFSGKFVVQ